ncbi:MAG: hypothetical protein ACKOEX_00335, partial [Planctomycetia bacterium]
MNESRARSHHHRHRRSRSRPPTAGERLERHCFDAALLAALVATPIAMGGRHPLGQCILTLAAGLATISWFLRAWTQGKTEWRWSLVDGFCAAGLAIGIVQIVPLPAQTLASISPHMADLLPGW